MIDDALERERLVALIPRLRRYARVLVHDAAAADDLVQDTLVRACEKWHLYRVGTDLRAWLFTIMHNLQASRWAGRPADTAPTAELPERGFDPSAHQGESIDLERALARLVPEARAVLALVAVESFTYAEAAQLLGLPVGTVMSRLSRARRQLRNLLDPGDGAGRSAPHGLRLLR